MQGVTLICIYVQQSTSQELETHQHSIDGHIFPLLNEKNSSVKGKRVKIGSTLLMCSKLQKLEQNFSKKKRSSNQQTVSSLSIKIKLWKGIREHKLSHHVDSAECK